MERKTGRKTRSKPFKCTSPKARDHPKMVEDKGKLTGNNGLYMKQVEIVHKIDLHDGIFGHVAC